MLTSPHNVLVSMAGEYDIHLTVERCGRNIAGRIIRYEHLGRASYGHPSIFIQLFGDLEILVRRFRIEYELETERLRSRAASSR